MSTFTKNAKTGNFDVIGTVDEMQVGSVTVTKKGGSTKTVTIERLSKPFVAKFGPLEGKRCVIGTVQQVTWQERENRGDRYYGTSYEGQYCGYPCPVSGKRCCPANGPCHDCE